MNRFVHKFLTGVDLLRYHLGITRFVGEMGLSTRRFYEDYAETKEVASTYDESPHQARRRFINSLLANMDRPIIDVGCGNGIYLADIGVDISKTALLKRGGSGVASHLSFLPFQDKVFRTVILSETLEHIPPSEALPALKEARRVCHDRIIVTVPCYGARRPIIKTMPSGEKCIHTAFKPAELTKIADAAGFQLQAAGMIPGAGGNTFYVGQVS